MPDGVDNQALVGWSPDGTRLLYYGWRLSLDDRCDRQTRRQAVATGCEAPATPRPSTCQQDSQVAFSPDGKTHRLRSRSSTDDAGNSDLSAIATMDLESGRVAVLSSTMPDGGWRPGWSPDGRQIVFSRSGDKDPYQPAGAAVFVIDADWPRTCIRSARRRSRRRMPPGRPTVRGSSSSHPTRPPRTACRGTSATSIRSARTGRDVRRLTTDGLSIVARRGPPTDGSSSSGRAARATAIRAGGRWTPMGRTPRCSCLRPRSESRPETSR